MLAKDISLLTILTFHNVKHLPVPHTGKIIRIFYKKKQWRPPSKKKKRGKNLSPRNRKAYNSTSRKIR
jgi:hypothetical protein